MLGFQHVESFYFIYVTCVYMERRLSVSLISFCVVFFLLLQLIFDVSIHMHVSKT